MRPPVTHDLRTLGEAQFSARRVALIGGGRWGRVYASVLRILLPPDGAIIWASRYNAAAARQTAHGGGTPIEVVADIPEILDQRPDAAFVVSSPYDHATHATALLGAGVPTLVEKPLVLCERDARELVTLSAQRTVFLAVGLQLMVTSYLRYFRTSWAERKVTSLRFVWCDPVQETRYGETKRADHSVPKAHDMVPHIWSMLRVLLDPTDISVNGAAIGEDAASEIELTADGIRVVAVLSRRASRRVRTVSATFSDGGSAGLDFTKEPGTITVDGSIAAPDQEWHRLPTPLTLQARGFLAACADPRSAANWPTRADKVIGSVTLAAEIARIVQRKELEALRTPMTEATAHALLIDNLTPEFAAEGLRGADAAAAAEAAAHKLLRGGMPLQLSALEDAGLTQSALASLLRHH